MRAITLARFLRGYVTADFVLVTSADGALQSLADRIPDLILTSTFLAPSEEATLTAHLKRLPAAASLQVITIPHFIDFEDVASDDSSKILNFLERRSLLVRPRCDPRTVRDQIEHYLERARAERLTLTCQGSGARGTPRLTPGDVYTLTKGIGPRTQKSSRVQPTDRRRAPRRASSELASTLTVRLPWGRSASLINISRQGVLLESTSKVPPGRTLHVELVGKRNPLTVAARTIRSEVAHVDASGVKYWIAAAFQRELEIEFVAAAVLQWAPPIGDNAPGSR
jgi:hypothetical protein